MKDVEKNIKYIICLFSSFYLTYIISISALNSMLQVIFIYSYFLTSSLIILYLHGKFLKNKINKNHKFKIVVFTIIIVLFGIFVINDKLIPVDYKENPIEITAHNEKNISSKGMEVWITTIRVDNKLLDLSEFELQNGWFYKSDGNVIFLNANYGNIQPLVLKLPKGKEIEITFVMHEWSGIIDIYSGEQNTTIDLYSPTGDTYYYNTDGEQNNISVFMKTILFLSAIILMYAIVFIILELCIFQFRW